MTKLITLALCLSALVGCDELSEAMTSHDLAIVEANGSTFVLDNSNGSVSVVSGDQLRPLKQASSEIFELEKDVALDSTVVDFEFLFSGSRVYWSGRIAPNPVSQEFESDEEYDLFMEQWFDNIRQGGNSINFGIEPLSSNINLAEILIEMSELSTRQRGESGDQVAWTGDGVESVSLDYGLIDSLGGTAALWLSPTYILDIED